MNSRHDEALEAGLNRREAGMVAFAADLTTFLEGLKADQSAFLDEAGLTWDEARALDGEGRTALNERWREWCQARIDAQAAPSP